MSDLGDKAYDSDTSFETDTEDEAPVAPAPEPPVVINKPLEKVLPKGADGGNPRKSSVENEIENDLAKVREERSATPAEKKEKKKRVATARQLEALKNAREAKAKKRKQTKAVSTEKINKRVAKSVAPPKDEEEEVEVKSPQMTEEERIEAIVERRLNAVREKRRQRKRVAAPAPAAPEPVPEPEPEMTPEEIEKEEARKLTHFLMFGE